MNNFIDHFNKSLSTYRATSPRGFYWGVGGGILQCPDTPEPILFLGNYMALLSIRDLKCHFRGHFNCSYRMDRQTNFFLIQYIEMLDNVAKISILN